MKTTLTAEDLRQMLVFVSQRIVQSEPLLTEIDLKIGDGDHGTGMEVGFRSISAAMEREPFDSANAVFRAAGLALLDEMGGASGVLFGTLFISGLVGRDEQSAWTLGDLAEIFTVALAAIKTRGGAKMGDKTMIDALEPAVTALACSAAKGESLLMGFQAAAEAATEGAEHTRDLLARFGRAKYYGENVLGLQDAGAVSVSIIFQAMSQWLQIYNDGEMSTWS